MPGYREPFDTAWTRAFAQAQARPTGPGAIRATTPLPALLPRKHVRAHRAAGAATALRARQGGRRGKAARRKAIRVAPAAALPLGSLATSLRSCVSLARHGLYDSPSRRSEVRWRQDTVNRRHHCQDGGKRTSPSRTSCRSGAPTWQRGDCSRCPRREWARAGSWYKSTATAPIGAPERGAPLGVDSPARRPYESQPRSRGCGAEAVLLVPRGNGAAVASFLQRPVAASSCRSSRGRRRHRRRPR